MRIVACRGRGKRFPSRASARLKHRPARLTVAALMVVLAGTASSSADAPIRQEPGGLILYLAQGDRSSLHTIRPDGTGHDRIMLGERDNYHYFPQISPDGSTVLFTLADENANWNLHTVSIDGEDRRRLTGGRRFKKQAQWSPDGEHISFVNSGRDEPWGRLRIMNADGSARRTLIADQLVFRPMWSPDGTKILYSRQQDCDFCRADYDVFVVEVADGTRTRLTKHRRDDLAAGWLPDGERVVFVGTRNRRSGFFVIRTDGSPAMRINRFRKGQGAFTGAVSPDGESIVYALTRDDLSGSQLRIAAVDGSEDHRLVEFEATQSPLWSPDGTRIAFSAFDDASWNLYVVNPDGTGLNSLAAGRRDEYPADWWAE